MTSWIGDAPAALRDQILEALQGVQGEGYPTTASPDLTSPRRLASAALDQLRAVLESSGDRASAYDLLTADALLTLAFEVIAEDPSEVPEFAQDIIRELSSLIPEGEGQGDGAGR